MSDLLPNTYPKPNKYSDLYDYYLTPEESRVLDFFIRHILGWESARGTRRNRLSLSQLCEGWGSDEPGKWRTHGTGLSRPTVVKVVKSLIEFGFIQEIGLPTKNGQEYELVLDDKIIDLSALIARKEGRKTQDQKRAQLARSARGQSDVSVNPIDYPDEVVNATNQQELMPLTSSSKCDLPQVVNAINTLNPLDKDMTKVMDKSMDDDDGAPAVFPAASPSPRKRGKQAQPPPTLDYQQAAGRKAVNARPAPPDTPPAPNLAFWLDYWAKKHINGLNRNILAEKALREKVTPAQVDALLEAAARHFEQKGERVISWPGWIFSNVTTHGWQWENYPHAQDGTPPRAYTAPAARRESVEDTHRRNMETIANWTPDKVSDEFKRLLYGK